MKSILKKVAGLAIAAVLVLGMFGCSNGSNDDPVLPPTSDKKTVATPVFSVVTGEVESGTKVTITCATEGAKIFYTTGDSAPTASSTEYTSAISVTEAVKIKAIAVKAGMNDSAVASVNYTVKPNYNACKVGDFILKNGTILSKDSNPESGTVAAVIVLAATEDKPALGVGIVHDIRGLSWCKSDASGYSKNITALQGDKTSDYMDGSDSWELLVSACEDLKNANAETIETVAQNYPAFNYCRKYGKTNGLSGELVNGWYLPTLAELYTIYQNKTVVDTSLSKAVGSQFDLSKYWSCCQNSSSNLNARALSFNGGHTSNDYKTENSIYVCAVRAFY